MTYRAPVADMLFAMRHVAGLDRLIEDGLAPGLEDGMSEAILEEAAKFAGGRLAPLNRVGDQRGAASRTARSSRRRASATPTRTGPTAAGTR